MRNRPLVCLLMSMFYFGVAFFIPLQVVIGLGASGNESISFSAIMQNLTNLNYLIIFLNIVLGFYSLNASSKMVPFLVLSLGFTYLNNWIVGEYALNFTSTHTILASVGYTITSLMVLSPSFMTLLKDQELRWWRISKRFKTHLQVSLISEDGHRITAPLHDISKSGAFFHLDQLTASVLDLNPGTTIQIGLPLFENVCLTFKKAKVVRVAPAVGNYPQGIGIRFNGDYDLKFQWQLKKFLKEQEKLSAVSVTA